MATRSPTESETYTVEEIELRRQDRDGLVPVAEKERLVLWLWAVYPKGRFWRTR